MKKKNIYKNSKPKQLIFCTTYRDACIHSEDCSLVKSVAGEGERRDTCKCAHYHVIRTPTARGRDSEMSLFKIWRLKCSLGSTFFFFIHLSLRDVIVFSPFLSFSFFNSNTFWRSLELYNGPNVAESKEQIWKIFYLFFLIREIF